MKPTFSSSKGVLTRVSRYPRVLIYTAIIKHTTPRQVFHIDSRWKVRLAKEYSLAPELLLDSLLLPCLCCEFGFLFLTMSCDRLSLFLTRKNYIFYFIFMNFYQNSASPLFRCQERQYSWFLTLTFNWQQHDDDNSDVSSQTEFR